MLILSMTKSKLKTLWLMQSKYLFLIIIVVAFNAVVMISVGPCVRKLKSGNSLLQSLLWPALADPLLVERLSLLFQRDRLPHHLTGINSLVTILKC